MITETSPQFGTIESALGKANLDYSAIIRRCPIRDEFGVHNDYEIEVEGSGTAAVSWFSNHPFPDADEDLRFSCKEYRFSDHPRHGEELRISVEISCQIVQHQFTRLSRSDGFFYHHLAVVEWTAKEGNHG